MEFTVLKITANNHLLLEEKGNKAKFINDDHTASKRFWIENRPVYLKGERVGKILEPIGSIHKPFFLAAIESNKSNLVGATLSDVPKR